VTQCRWCCLSYTDTRPSFSCMQSAGSHAGLSTTTWVRSVDYQAATYSMNGQSSDDLLRRGP
jgi:hypothetical protein